MNNQVITKTINSFNEKGFVAIKGIIDLQLLKFLEISSKIVTKLANPVEIGNTAISGNTSYIYGNIIGDSFLTYLTPYYSKIANKDLIPTYSFFRTYQKGSKLKPHKDREACQYSATIQINRSKNEDWTFFIQNDQKKLIFPLNPSIGDIIFYKGEQMTHWREPLKYDFSSHIFMHWVDKNNPKYKKYWFDGRSPSDHSFLSY